MYQLYKVNVEVAGSAQIMTIYVSAQNFAKAKEKATEAVRTVFPGRYFEMDVKAN